jgi:tRNA dimethylallyltransferase
MVQKNSLNKILIICGPTASGKSAVALECAKILDSEIIYADSMDIYKTLDIGTAKPSINEQTMVKHHLIDVVNPNSEFTVSDYKNLAEPIIKELLYKGKVPIICGGTGFYINSILYDLSYGNGKGDEKVREKYKRIANDKGNEYVYNLLQKIDPDSAKKIHQNDVKRVIRALEIAESGTIKSKIADDLTPKYNYDAYSIDFDRDSLYKRINDRVDLMIASGLVNEVKNLIEQGITINDQCMQGIGYKEIYSYLKDEISLEQAIDLIKLNTRHYAKRQITFFKRLNGLKLLPPEDPKILAKRIVDAL